MTHGCANVEGELRFSAFLGHSLAALLEQMPTQGDASLSLRRLQALTERYAGMNTIERKQILNNVMEVLESLEKGPSMHSRPNFPPSGTAPRPASRPPSVRQTSRNLGRPEVASAPPIPPPYFPSPRPPPPSPVYSKERSTMYQPGSIKNPLNTHPPSNGVSQPPRTVPTSQASHAPPSPARVLQTSSPARQPVVFTEQWKIEHTTWTEQAAVEFVPPGRNRCWVPIVLDLETTGKNVRLFFIFYFL